MSNSYNFDDTYYKMDKNEDMEMISEDSLNDQKHKTPKCKNAKEDPYEMLTKNTQIVSLPKGSRIG